jgi:hypothetical protein
MAQFLTDIGSVVTMLVGNFADILSLWVSNPILTVSFGIMITGAVIGLVMRVIHRN